MSEEGDIVDPNLFAIDWEQTGEVLVTIVVLAFFVERALALVFENQWYLEKLGASHVKELVAFLLSALVCVRWRIDALSVILHGDRMTFLGELLTAGVIAGGSKASLKLFRDVMGVENDQAKIERKKNATAFESKVTAPASTEAK
ncbi:MAG TPA: hypothetical protein VNI81_02095 [Candidatus Limnocylindrales bacterium]|nr:hypothetical protein [Candidatus Limnocylindrales bacterium]